MRRLLSGVGRTLITAGVLLLLFVAYQLWGTNIRQAQEQRKLKSGFESELAAAGITPIEFDDVSTGTFAVDPGTDTTGMDTTGTETTGTETTVAETTVAATIPAVTTPAPASVTPTSVGPTPTTLPTVRAGRSTMKAPLPGRAVGLIVIPRIKQRQVVVEGTNKKDLEAGPGRYSRSAYPGQPGNAAIAGHRTTFGAPFFNLGLLRPGDPIFIQTQQGKFRYDVIDACRPRCTGSGSFIVSPTDSTVLAPTPGENLLTLTTCHPKYTAQKRLIVRAKLVGPAADADFFAPPPPPPTTAVPVTTAAPTTVAPPESVPDIAESTENPTVAIPDTTVAAPIGSEVVATDETIPGDAPSLVSERDPGGTGPVWKIGLFQGHRSTWSQTGLLSAMCAAIWLGCWWIARQRRLAAQAVIYTVGFVVLFLPALYFTFEVLSRLLPENL